MNTYIMGNSPAALRLLSLSQLSGERGGKGKLRLLTIQEEITTIRKEITTIRVETYKRGTNDGTVHTAEVQGKSNM
jgi:hypothetical protein